MVFAANDPRAHNSFEDPRAVEPKTVHYHSGIRLRLVHPSEARTLRPHIAANRANGSTKTPLAFTASAAGARTAGMPHTYRLLAKLNCRTMLAGTAWPLNCAGWNFHCSAA